MDLGLKGKTALVTAASKGLGKASALELAQEGCNLAICSRSQSEIERTAQEIIDKTGVQVKAYPIDLSQEKEIESLIQRTQEDLGSPDVLVINAGGPPPGNYASTPKANYRPALELTLMSGVLLTQACLPPMRKKGFGRIVMISSISVKQPIPQLLLSNMARAGLTGFMKTVATEVAADGVTLNAVLPGAHLTDRVRNSAQHESETTGETLQEVLERMENNIPMRRIGDPKELAALVAFLASERASYITGSSILVDGGSYKGLF